MLLFTLFAFGCYLESEGRFGGATAFVSHTVRFWFQGKHLLLDLGELMLSYSDKFALALMSAVPIAGQNLGITDESSSLGSGKGNVG